MSRLSLLAMVLLAVMALSGCPKGMPSPVVPDVGTGQPSGGPVAGGPSSPTQPSDGTPTPGAPGATAGPAPSGAGPGKASGGQAAPQSKGGSGGLAGGPAVGTKAGGAPGANAGTKGGKAGGRQGRGGFMSQLTDAQRKEFEAKMAQLRAKGASREEIFKATGDMFKKWGIKLPQIGQGGGRGFGGEAFGKLTEAQRGQFLAKMREMRERNASREDIRAEAEKMLKGWGVDTSKIEWPSGRGGQGGQGRPGGGGPGSQAPPGGSKGDKF